ncbi:HdeD family acid-resistance protein [Tsukamurella soli]|uniref:HdeD family acid-resistance protein n=1 Tax=Tsukamurella soli TaxID=644556 RepID=A0ABP8JQT1_9ACTN
MTVPTNPIRQLANATWQVTITLGVASVIIGVAILAWPGKSLLVAGSLFAAYLLVSGFFQVVAGLFGEGHHRILGIASGALSIILGCICLRSAAETLLLLAIWIGIGWVFRGVFITSSAAGAPEVPNRPWAVFTGIVTVLGGIVLLVSPFGSLAVLTLVAGIWAVVLGLIEIVSGFQLRRAVTAHL